MLPKKGNIHVALTFNIIELTMKLSPYNILII